MSIALRQSQMDIFDFILLPRDRFYGGMGVWYHLPCGTGGGFPLSLASHDSGSVLAVKGPPIAFTDCQLHCLVMPRLTTDLV